MLFKDLSAIEKWEVSLCFLVKSKLVKRPEDYRWSSCKSNISGESDGKLSKQGWLDLMKRIGMHTDDF